MSSWLQFREFLSKITPQLTALLSPAHFALHFAPMGSDYGAVTVMTAGMT